MSKTLRVECGRRDDRADGETTHPVAR